MLDSSRSDLERHGVVPRRSDSLASDLLLPDETLEVRREVRAFADSVLRPIARELNCEPERRDGFRHDVFDRMASAGLFAIPFPEDVGGRALRYPTLATLSVLEELAYYAPGIASSMYDAQAILVGNTLNQAPPALRGEFLPRLVRGEFVASFATSEPGASTDLSVRSVQTVAHRHDEGWLVTGRKRWITNAVAARYVILLCRTGDALSLLFVDMHAPGVSVSDPDMKMGNHAQLTADIEFKNVLVPHHHVLGEIGAGLRSALGSLVLGRMGIGAVGVGMAQRAFDISSHYISHRSVFERPIAAFQHWQFRFAEHAMQIDSARSAYQRAALLTDRGENAEVLAAMAKVMGSSAAVEMSRDAIQCCGGYGFVRTLGASGEDWPLESIYRDAKIGEIYEGFGRAITG